MKQRLQILGLVLPLIALAFMIGQAEWRLAHSETWIFNMQGYDPRDLLRGHYLIFQLEIEPKPHNEEASVCDPITDDCCYCLTPGAEIARVGFETELTSLSCSQAQTTCSAFVRAEPLQSLRRFYIPESHREMLEDRLFEAQRARMAHLLVAVDENGYPAISQMILQGETIESVVEGAEGP